MVEKRVRPFIDWDGVEIQYRAGIRSLMDIAKEYGVSDAGILKRAKTKGWTRDLKDKIKAKADAKVRAAVVREKVSDEKAVSETLTVDANAELQFQVRIKHRKGLERLSAIQGKLINHLESVADNLHDLTQVIADLRNPDENGQDKANDRLRKAMDRSVVIDDLKKLAEVDEKVRKGEREAHGIDDDERSGSPIDAILAKINAT